MSNGSSEERDGAVAISGDLGAEIAVHGANHASWEQIHWNSYWKRELRSQPSSIAEQSRANLPVTSVSAEPQSRPTLSASHRGQANVPGFRCVVRAPR
jgi:hypothetical protein